MTPDLKALIERKAEEYARAKYKCVGSVVDLNTVHGKADFTAGAELLATVLGEYGKALEAAGEALRWGSGQHYECDDGWYSCPMAENYIQDDKGSRCDCGFEEKRKAKELIGEALSAGRRILEGK